ncbi:MAG TPA: hypothetical protein VJH03_24045 [Blastocatellia bacterium]|nr:hypothetical protein [Blastocatellia bacterium]
MPRPISYQRNSEGFDVPLDGHIVGEKSDVCATVKVYRYQNVNSNYRIEAAVKPKQALVSSCLADKAPPAKIGGLTVPLERLSTGPSDGGLAGVKQGVKIIDLV